jgi:excinuclease ABC subunit A
MNDTDDLEPVHAAQVIAVRGARTHNLRNIDVDIPRNRLVVVTGLSGSGKSSLAFDTIFAEGQRRFVESLSAYARQFLGQLDKPDVDRIDGLSPAIAIDQRSVSRNPRSTVGTVTEIHDHLRLLFARIGIPHCPQCGRRVEAQSVTQMVDAIAALPEGTRLILLAPVWRGRKGEGRSVIDEARADGYARVRVDGTVYPIDEVPNLDPKRAHDIEVVIDRLVASPDLGNRLADSLETALRRAFGQVIVHVMPSGDAPTRDLLFSELYACVPCGLSFESLEPRNFSFNNPRGACPDCTGLGTTLEIDPDLVIPNRHLSFDEGAIVAWPAGRDSYTMNLLAAVGRAVGFTMAQPVETLSEAHLELVLHGSGRGRVPMPSRRGAREVRVAFEGVIPNLARRYAETESPTVKEEIEQYMMSRSCPACNGARLKPASRAVTVGDASLARVSGLTVDEADAFFAALGGVLGPRDQVIARPITKEVRARLRFLRDVGLGYLTLDRASGTLSGGEAQRIRLATQIGSGLMGVLYILDEPSIGLHQRDNDRLIATMCRLRDLGNTLVVVEHDEDTVRAADWVIDVGPGAGEHGGRIVATGTPAQIMADDASLTGAYLSGRRTISRPLVRRAGNGYSITVRGARAHNLRGIDVTFPLGCLVGVTGVSGSGKSSLVTDILYRRLAQIVHRAHARAGAHDSIEGAEYLDKVIDVDQAPIGRTPRSNPATFTGMFTTIRETFAKVPEARVRGYGPGRFSFNVKGGRCETCQGEGMLRIEMHFLPDVHVPCESCSGKRYNREALEILFKGKHVADVLDMTVTEALAFFGSIPALRHKLQVLADVGLGYVRLGQPATTLSGGEAQRLKLATELARRATGRTMYILDEPTTGLHAADVANLLGVLHRLVDSGNSVVVIEHNLDVIAASDWVIDLGPDGGTAGGSVVVAGPPEVVASCAASHTGGYLRRMFDREA